MAPRKPKQEKSSVPLEEMEPVDEKKIKKQTQTAKKVTSKKEASKQKAQSPEKVMGKKEISISPKDTHPKTHHTHDLSPMLLGAGLLIMGFLLLAGRFLNIQFNDFLWPFIFIVPGALVFLSALSSESSSGEGLSIVGGILSMLGFVFLMQTITGLWAS